MKVATIDNVKVGDEVFIRTKVVDIDNGNKYSIDTDFAVFASDGKHVIDDTEPSLFIAEPEFKPRMMYVWHYDTPPHIKYKFFVVEKANTLYIAKDENGKYLVFEYACEVEETCIQLDIPESKLEAVKKLLAE